MPLTRSFAADIPRLSLRNFLLSALRIPRLEVFAMKIRRVFLLSLAVVGALSPLQVLAQFGTSAMAPVPAYATAPTPVITNQPIVGAPAPIVTGPAAAGPPAFVGPPAYTDPYYSPAPGAVASPGFGVPLLAPAVTPDCDPVCGAPGIYVFGEIFNWEAHFPGTPYTLEITDFPPPDLIPDAQFHAGDLGDDFGFRGGIGWRFCDGWDIGVIYTSFETSGNDGVGDRVDDLGQFVVLDPHPLFALFPFFVAPFADTFPLTADEVNERLSLEYNALDLEAGRKFCICQTLVLRPFFGLRFAQFDSARTTTFIDWVDAGVDVGDPDDDTIDVYNVAKRVQIDGLGPKIGSYISWNINDSGFQVFASGAASLLISDVDVDRADRLVVDANDAVPDFDGTSRSRLNFQEVIPVTEIALGVRWERGRFFISGGYELQNWFNVVTDVRYDAIFAPPVVPDLISATSGVSIDRGDIGLGGWFVRVGSNF
jgi:hypothetical protein